MGSMVHGLDILSCLLRNLKLAEAETEGGKIIDSMVWKYSLAFGEILN